MKGDLDNRSVLQAMRVAGYTTIDTYIKSNGPERKDNFGNPEYEVPEKEYVDSDLHKICLKRLHLDAKKIAFNKRVGLNKHYSYFDLSTFKNVIVDCETGQIISKS